MNVVLSHVNDLGSQDARILGWFVEQGRALNGGGRKEAVIEVGGLGQG